MPAHMTRKWYSVTEVAEMLGCGLTKTKFLVLSGQITRVAWFSARGAIGDT